MDQSTAPYVNENPRTQRVAGHFGELLQGRMGPDGPVVLVTLPCPVLETQVRWTLGGAFRVVGQETEMARGLATDLIAEWDLAPAGQLEVTRPAATGTGAGSSTAELLATLRVMAARAGRSLGPDEEAARCHRVEGAIDPLMYPGNVLFASRTPAVVETLPPLPPFQVVGGFAGPGQRTDPQDHDFPDMTHAVAQLKAGLATGDVRQIAEAARISAEANQARNPNPAWDELVTVGQDAGALGPVVSHTGSAIGLILSEDMDPAPLKRELTIIGLTGVISFRPARP